MKTVSSTSTARDFGQERSEEAQMALRYLLTKGANESFSGCFEVVGAPELEILDEKIVAETFGASLKRFAEHEGAEVGEWAGEQGAYYEPGRDGRGIVAAPAEQVKIGAILPPEVLTDPHEAKCHAIQACAEPLRVLLAAAISAAKEDAEDGEVVRAMFHGAPQFIWQPDLESGAIAVGGEMTVNVFTANEPRVSYIVGSAAGKPPRRIEYLLPTLNLYYGPNRLRWCDQRAPDAQRELQIVGGAR